MGLGWFLGGLVLVPVLPQVYSHHFNHLNLINCETNHTCVFQSESTRLRGWCIIISLLVPWLCLLCQHASMPEVCTSMPEGHPWSVWASLDVSRGPRCPEGHDMVPLRQMAQSPQDCTYCAILLKMMIFV